MCRDAIEAGRLPRDDCEDLEAYLYIGVPAAAIFSALVVRVGEHSLFPCPLPNLPPPPSSLFPAPFV